MADHSSKPSFSPGRKWAIAFDLAVRTAVVLAVVAMLNYLGGRYFQRLYLSSQTRVELSPRTLTVLRSLTNSVKVTLYYDKSDPLYPTIAALIDEYQAINPRISVESVDYTRDSAEAQRVKSAYKLSTSSGGSEKDLVIFDCDGRYKVAEGRQLADYKLEQVPNSSEREFRRKIVSFNGELMFTATLLAVTDPKPLKAYSLEGDGEHGIADTDATMGYSKFASTLQQNYIQVEPLSLLGTNDVPGDCNLLIIAGPTRLMPDAELDKIQHYLEQGGRLFVLFNAFTKDRLTGLEKVLAQWGVVVDGSVVHDPEHHISDSDVIVTHFSTHPVVDPIIGSAIQLVLPRSIRAEKNLGSNPDAPQVDEIAFAGPHSTLVEDPTQEMRAWPLAVAVEKGAVPGVTTARGATRILVVGDSFFLGNRQIDSGVNRDFAGYAANWLLERTALLEGLGPRPVDDFRIIMTSWQLKQVEWVLLAALPGAVMLLGAFVWLSRRR
jgi:hypothetical protein